jgi:hypothetical protein
VQWTVTFCRQYDFLRSGANWALVHTFIDPILMQSPTYRDVLGQIKARNANVERSDALYNDPAGYGATSTSLLSRGWTIQLNWGTMDTICQVAEVVAHEYGHVDTFVDNPGLTAEMLAVLKLVNERSYIDARLELELQAHEFALRVLLEAAQNTPDKLTRDCIKAQILRDPVLKALSQGDYPTARNLLARKYCANGCSELLQDWNKTQAISDAARSSLEEAVGQKASQLVASSQWQQETALWSPLIPSGIG